MLEYDQNQMIVSVSLLQRITICIVIFLRKGISSHRDNGTKVENIISILTCYH